MAGRQRTITDADRRAAAKVRDLWAEYQKRNPGISQESAAQRADMTQSAFSQFLQGKVPMRRTPVFKLARLFGVPPAAIRDDLQEFSYGHGVATAKQARDAASEKLSHDALEIANVFERMSPQTQDFIREIVFTYGIVDQALPWLRQGRPRSHNYGRWEKWHEDNYRTKLALEAQRISKK